MKATIDQFNCLIIKKIFSLNSTIPILTKFAKLLKLNLSDVRR